MTTISELVTIMQQEYPNLYILDEDMFKGEPALVYDTDEFLISYWVDDEMSHMFFEEYDTSIHQSIHTDEIDDPAELYQLLSNFVHWVASNLEVDSETVNTLNKEILKPLKKQGHSYEQGWDALDYD